MKKGLCEIIVVADRSGSMGIIRADAIGAFNTFLDEQKKHPGEALMTYTQFDDTYEIVHNGKPLKDVPNLDEKTYIPRGSTALLDAVGRTIDDVGKRLASTPEDLRPEQVMMVIMTDGEENASRTFTRIQVFDKIKLQRETYRWEFIFLAAGQDAFHEANALGIPQVGIYAYMAGDAVQHRASVARMSSSTMASRGKS